MRAAFSDGDMYTLRPSEDDVNRVVIATLERTGGSNDQVHAGLLAHVRKWLSDIPDQACDPLELKQMALQMERAPAVNAVMPTRGEAGGPPSAGSEPGSDSDGDDPGID